jgi:uncharacterized membrane protein
MNNIEELEKLANLRDSGAITEKEFQKKKKSMLNSGDGKKEKSGCFGVIKKLFTGVIVIFVIIVVIAINSDKTPSLDAIAELEKEPISDLQPQGDLASTFAIMGTSTDLQRENKLNEIKGKVVQWSLPVFEIKASGKGYHVQTYGMTNGLYGTPVVPAFLEIMPRNDEERKIIEQLKTGNFISFKGKIIDSTVRHLNINPAVLEMPTK